MTQAQLLADWLGGFSSFLAGCGRFWVAYYFSSYGCKLFAFCLTCLFVLVNLVPALTEQFLWKYNHAFSQGQLLYGYILPIF